MLLRNPNSEFSVTFHSEQAFIWNTEAYLCLQWKYWFFCSTAPDTLPQTHFYIGELWLKMEQFPSPDLHVRVTCWGHIFLCSHGQSLTECLCRIQLSQAHSRGLCRRGTVLGKNRPGSMNWPKRVTFILSYQTDNERKESQLPFPLTSSFSTQVK